MLTDLQKKTAQAVVNIFETGKALGDYGRVTVMKGDTGHLSYGRSQTSLGSGNLALLMHDYCNAGGLYSGALTAYLPAFDNRDNSLDTNAEVKSLLTQAGGDPIMQSVQDAFFEKGYWTPAVKSAAGLGISMPLGINVVYDGFIQGAFGTIRDITNGKCGTPGSAGEQKWIAEYVAARRDWLANNKNALLHNTVYRMDEFNKLIGDEAWQLPLPLSVRGVVISEDLFNPSPSVSTAPEDTRVLSLTNPMMTGDDVKRLQQALGLQGSAADGVFGNGTDKAVKDFQAEHGLTPDGKVGPATRVKLGI